jgi:hypothetical protein
MPRNVRRLFLVPYTDVVRVARITFAKKRESSGRATDDDCRLGNASAYPVVM